MAGIPAIKTGNPAHGIRPGVPPLTSPSTLKSFVLGINTSAKRREEGRGYIYIRVKTAWSVHPKLSPP